MADQFYNLLDEKTAWVFIVGSCDEHDLIDLVFSLRILSILKVPTDRITVFISIAKEFSDDLVNSYPELKVGNFHHTSLLNASKMPTLEQAVIVVGGHGHDKGLATDPTLTPHSLNNLINQCPNLKRALVVFGQCYAGVFNYLSVNETNVRKCFIGATSLTTSSGLPQAYISMDDELRKIVREVFGSSWAPNFFLFQFFRWLLFPQDMDGDGVCSVTDMFKFVLINTAETLQRYRVELAHKLFSERQSSKNDGAQAEDNEVAQLASTLLRENALKKELETLFSEQSPWILNANLSRELIFIPHHSPQEQ